jgi:hypothetical protein
MMLTDRSGLLSDFNGLAENGPAFGPAMRLGDGPA